MPGKLLSRKASFGGCVRRRVVTRYPAPAPLLCRAVTPAAVAGYVRMLDRGWSVPFLATNAALVARHRPWSLCCRVLSFSGIVNKNPSTQSTPLSPADVLILRFVWLSMQHSGFPPSSLPKPVRHTGPSGSLFAPPPHTRRANMQQATPHRRERFMPHLPVAGPQHVCGPTIACPA